MKDRGKWHNTKRNTDCLFLSGISHHCHLRNCSLIYRIRLLYKLVQSDAKRVVLRRAIMAVAEVLYERGPRLQSGSSLVKEAATALTIIGSSALPRTRP